MILQELVKYYERLAEQGKVSKPGWCSAKVSYCLDLRPDGTVARVISCLKEEERGKKKGSGSPGFYCAGHGFPFLRHCPEFSL